MIGLCFGGLVGAVAGWLASLIARRRDPLPDQWLASAVGDAGAGTFDPPRVVPPTFTASYGGRPARTFQSRQAEDDYMWAQHELDDAIARANEAS